MDDPIEALETARSVPTEGQLREPIAARRTLTATVVVVVLLLLGALIAGSRWRYAYAVREQQAAAARQQEAAQRAYRSALNSPYVRTMDSIGRMLEESMYAP